VLQPQTLECSRIRTSPVTIFFRIIAYYLLPHPSIRAYETLWL